MWCAGGGEYVDEVNVGWRRMMLLRRVVAVAVVGSAVNVVLRKGPNDLNLSENSGIFDAGKEERR